GLPRVAGCPSSRCVAILAWCATMYGCCTCIRSATGVAVLVRLPVHGSVVDTVLRYLSPVSRVRRVGARENAASCAQVGPEMGPVEVPPACESDPGVPPRH